MKQIVLIISIIAIFYSTVEDISAQSSYSKFRQKKQSIEYVKTILQDKPEEAVRLLNEVIASSNAREDIETISHAYELLGDINVNNELFKDAIIRYNKANDYAVIANAKHRIALLNQKMGDSFLALRSEEAKGHFKICMDYAIHEDTYYFCYEGFADSYRLQDSLHKALNIYTSIETKYIKSNDPSLARIQAKIADTYASLSKIDEAILNYSNAQQNYSSSNIKDDNALRNSSENIILNQTNIDQEIQIRNSNIDLYANRPARVAEEKIQLADAYVRSGKTSTAETTLNDVKPILQDLPIKTKAEYYKKTSEISDLKGNPQSAIDDYKEYVRFRDSILEEQEAGLSQRFKINELQTNIDLLEKDYINERNRIAFQKNLVRRQQYIIGLLGLLLLGALLSFIAIYKNVQAKKKANKLLELRSLRSAMNPHFIFNALGSVNNYIAEKDSRKANKYLADFSKLMRSVLEMNQQDLIPLKDELQLSELYTKLEHGRWSDKFDYSINIDYNSIPEDLMVPPLLIQPYIENAVWHGLRYRTEKGQLQIHGTLINNRYVIEIIDNGIGRKESMKLKTENQKKYTSTGIKNTKRRTELINEIYSKNYTVQIEDNSKDKGDVGTQVKIELK